MHIDLLSTKLIQIALYLDRKIPGIVSEIWIDQNQLKELQSAIIPDSQLASHIAKTKEEVNQLDDQRRKTYLLAMIDSIEYQIQAISSPWQSFSEFSKNAFGFEMKRVTDNEIHQIEQKIHELEKKLGMTQQQVFEKNSLQASEYQTTFEEFVDKAKQVLPTYITDFPDEGFEFEVVQDKPWSAFNTHLAPFRSKLTLNSDVSFTQLDLYRLAFHEAYGGHHSELSQKDRLLTEDGKGEHGLVVTFSPQTFVSEAIAEGIFVLLGGLTPKNNELLLGWYYDRLIFAAQNVATFWYFDDHLSREEIKKKLEQFALSKQSIQYIVNFSTDELFGKYAPVYYSAFNFLEHLYNNTQKKEKLIRTLFTQPCTPQLLRDEFE